MLFASGPTDPPHLIFGGVEFGPLLGLVLGLKGMADGAEAAGEVGRLDAAGVGQVDRLGQQAVGGPEVLANTFDAIGRLA